MPQMKFTDTAVAKLATDKTTWFSDPTCKGLQLCVTGGGSKTWYANRWDAQAQKTRRIKLGAFARKVQHCRWARSQAEATGAQVEQGFVRTKTERAAAKQVSLPTFREALEQMIEFKSNPERRQTSGKRAMGKTTARDYRGSFDCHLARWADVPVDKLPVFDISVHLDELQKTKRHAARRAAAVASSTIRFIARRAKREDLRIPTLTDPTVPRSRADEGGDIDMKVPLADRWAEIEQVENEHKRLCLQLTVYSGLRGRPLRELTWDRVYQVKLDHGRTAWAVNLVQPVKKQVDDREIVLSNDAARIIERLREIRFDDCDWVFPSHRVCGGVRGHLDVIDRFGGTTVNVLRHYWMPIARTHIALATLKWLALHSMKASGFGMAGHYGVATREEQYEAANVIASKVNQEIGLAPNSIVEIKRATA